MVMIGIDPHKRTHTAVAVDGSADIVASRLVHTNRGRTRELLSWADGLATSRTWAIESAGGLGYLLAQQLVAAGEEVIDIPAVLAARVRVLSSGTSNKNDPNDAYTVALAAVYGKDTVRDPLRGSRHGAPRVVAPAHPARLVLQQDRVPPGTTSTARRVVTPRLARRSPQWRTRQRRLATHPGRAARGARLRSARTCPDAPPPRDAIQTAATRARCGKCPPGLRHDHV